jgi:hypothetical protein
MIRTVNRWREIQEKIPEKTWTDNSTWELIEIAIQNEEDGGKDIEVDFPKWELSIARKAEKLCTSGSIASREG